MAKLIAGYWDVTSGSITLGDHEMKDIPLSEIADQISYVSQDNYLFNRSIRENIRMGRPSATDAEVEQAARQSGCDALSAGWITAMIRLSVVLVPTFPAASASGLPSPVPC